MTALGVVTNRKKVDERLVENLRGMLTEVGFGGARWYEAKKGSAAKGATQQAVADGADVILAVGGDGTVRACADALAGSDVALAVLPAGTANLFASALSLPKDAGAVLEAIMGGATRRLDLGNCDGMRFGVMSGSGYDAAIMERVDDGPKERFGTLAYVWAGVREARQQEPTTVRVTVDGEDFYRGPATCVLVGNLGELKAGVAAFPEASPTDGLLDVGVVTAGTLREWAEVAVRLVAHRPAKSRNAHMSKGRKIDVTWAPGGSAKEKKRADEIPFELDGGAKGAKRKLHYTCEPGALRLVIPSEAHT
jgi:YegS/Rv2252/BmrU family lipid kinase